MSERRLTPRPEPTQEELQARRDLYQKLEGDVVWVPGDTERTYSEKVLRYKSERLKAANRGEPTWIRANFDSDRGAAYDYYRDHKHVGTVIVDENDCDVWDANPGPEGPQSLTDGPGVQLEEAVAILEAHGL